MACLGVAEASTPNWTGKYAPCNHHSDLLKRQHVDLGVRISTSNPILAQQFEKAMSFWTGVLDFTWHEVHSQDCAIQLVDGTPALFDFCVCLSARSQFPDRPAFQGWIAFNPRMRLTKEEMFVDSVHEIGHLLGLPHNPSESSIMFYFGLDKTLSLDATDLQTLAASHRLRPGIATGNRLRQVRVIEPGQIEGHSQGLFRGLAAWLRPLRFWSNAGAVASVVVSPR
jgi:hypothetical protein